MPTILRALFPDGSPDPAALAEAARLLAAGRLVAIPTETVYGLAANALDPAAVRRIFEAKGRPTFNPLIVHVADVGRARTLSTHWPALADRLAARFWPGPLTLVVPRAPSIPDEVTGGGDSVGLRLPAHPVARALLALLPFPLAAPSANRSLHVSPTRAAHVVSSLGDRVDAILDAGPCDVGIESTVLDLTRDPPRVLRPGGLSLDALRQLVPGLEAPTIVQDEGPRASPGQLARHYAPDAATQLVPAGQFDAVLDRLPADARIGALTRTVTPRAASRLAAWRQIGPQPAEFTRDLYDALHELERAGVTHLLVEATPDTPEWLAVNDRLRRATTAA